MNLTNFFENNWKLLFFLTSLILALLIIFFMPQLIVNYSVQCNNGETRHFNNFEEAYLYEINCSKNMNNYINNDNISFYNGIK